MPQSCAATTGTRSVRPSADDRIYINVVTDIIQSSIDTGIEITLCPSARERTIHSISAPKRFKVRDKTNRMIPVRVDRRDDLDIMGS